MLFSSPFFMYIFLPAFFCLFFLAGRLLRPYLLLAGSFGFYFWGEPSFSLIVVASGLLDYYLGNKIYSYFNQKHLAKKFLITGIVGNLALLIYFKYTNFFLSSFTQLFLGHPFKFDAWKILLPLGISFIVFEKITYIVDIYRGTGKPAKSLLNYFNYIFLFPKLLAGPIIKYHEIEPQLENRSIKLDDVLIGFKRFVIGLLKKVFIADTLGEIVTQVFNLPSTGLSFYYAWLGVFCFTFQIYFDFSGYSDMALGLVRMMGFKLPENFNMPYISASFTEFWRRWHISLSTWIRDYLYIPLGGNHRGTARMYANLWICFLLSGLWHGANWTFVIWGAYNGLFLILDKLFWLKWIERLPRIIPMTITFFLVMIGWVIFRSSDLAQLQNFLHAMFNPLLNTRSYIDITPNIVAALFIGLFISLSPVAPIFRTINSERIVNEQFIFIENMILGLLGFFVACKIVGVTFSPFLYFRF